MPNLLILRRDGDFFVRFLPFGVFSCIRPILADRKRRLIPFVLYTGRTSRERFFLSAVY